MNEYRVTLCQDGRERALIVEAETAANARDLAEDDTGADVIAVKFLRSVTFGCHPRGAMPRG